MEKLEKVREIVKNACLQYRDAIEWEYHVSLVHDYALFLAEKLNANKEIVELAAWLHDIGRIKYGKENHEITGAIEAEKILKEAGYSSEIISAVKQCIETHRGSVNKQPETLEAEIVRNADAMAHFDTLPLLIKAGLKNYNNDILKAVEYVNKKLERSWNKITIPYAKELVEKKYEAIKLVLEKFVVE